jgi:hypothetical protein
VSESAWERQQTLDRDLLHAGLVQARDLAVDANVVGQVENLLDVDSLLLDALPPYDIDSALRSRAVIYWRVPQYTEQIEAGDVALIWRSGREAGFIGWGVFLTQPEFYDLSGDDDPFAGSGFPQDIGDPYAPIRVWPGGHVPNAEVSPRLDGHRLITARHARVERRRRASGGAPRPSGPVKWSQPEPASRARSRAVSQA